MSWLSEVVLAEAVVNCSDINSFAEINGERLSQFMVACYHGNPDYVQDMLEAPGIKIDLQNSEGRHALMCASELGHTQVVQLILNACQFQHNVVNLQDENGMTALMVASKDNYAETALLLLQNGAVVNMQDSKGWSALMIASKNGCTATVSVLLQNGADVNMKNKDGSNSLIISTKKEIAALLIQSGGAFIIPDGEH